MSDQLSARKKLLDELCPLTGVDLNRVKEMRSSMLSRGYPLLAIHGPWSLATGGDGKPVAAGKQPKAGRKEADGTRRKWTDPAQDARQPTALLRVTKICCNTGLVLGQAMAGFDWSFVAVDIDIDDADRAEEVLDCLFTAVGLDAALYDEGRLPVRERPNSGRRAVILRASVGSVLKPLPSVMTDWGKIEFLGEGDQVVIDGWHPSAIDGSAPLVWSPHHIADFDPAGMAEVTAQELETMHRYARAEFPGARLLTPGDGKPRAAPRKPSFLDIDEPPVPLAELLIIAGKLPNTMIDWDGWKGVGLAMFAASHGADYGLFAWAVWSHKIENLIHDIPHSYVEQWDRMKGSPPSVTGMGGLVERVRRATGNPSWSVGDG